MIKSNTNYNIPFLLKPYPKDYLWGGNKLNEIYMKNIDIMPLAETWECSTHPDGVSTICSGKFKGELLSNILKEHPYLLGKHCEELKELPILVKLIDSQKNLSIQVHPDDDYANTMENGQNGKNEMWYVLSADENANLIYGFNHEVTKEDIKKSIYDCSIEKYMQKVPVRENDVFYIPAGTVHAICSGVVIAEVQQSSNLTYRLYDYDRIDNKGNKRELHIDKALDVIKFTPSKTPKQPLRVLKYKKGCAQEFLCRNKYFNVERMIINTENCGEIVTLQTDELSFMVLLCTKGDGTISYNEDVLNVKKGKCVFVPANSIEIKINGRLEFLKITC